MSCFVWRFILRFVSDISLGDNYVGLWGGIEMLWNSHGNPQAYVLFPFIPCEPNRVFRCVAHSICSKQFE